MNAKVTKLFQPGPDYIALREYLSSVGDGVKLGWVDIEKASGVRMDVNGQALVRRVMSRLSRHYLAMPGFGIETSSARNAVDIATSKFVRVKNAVESAKDTGERLLGRHGDEMKASDRQLLEAKGATLATLDLVRSLAAKPKE
jgi:hypothetical protein